MSIELSVITQEINNKAADLLERLKILNGDLNYKTGYVDAISDLKHELLKVVQ